jgi:hypothetical protein
MNCKNVSTKGLVWQKNFFVVVESLSINYVHDKMKFMLPINANPIISMWGERNNFSMVLVGHRFV